MSVSLETFTKDYVQHPRTSRLEGESGWSGHAWIDWLISELFSKLV
jgi:hypothetical protein